LKIHRLEKSKEKNMIKYVSCMNVGRILTEHQQSQERYMRAFGCH
jgi:hypothetical protein